MTLEEFSGCFKVLLPSPFHPRNDFHKENKLYFLILYMGLSSLELPLVLDD
jgi:hypothetical protein